jgi:hypothetical protein
MDDDIIPTGMKELAYDPDDPSAQREETIRFLEKVLLDIVDWDLQHEKLTDADRKTLTVSKRDLYAFGELDKHFIAPHVESSPDTAAFGYSMLRLLMQASFYIGSRGTVSDSADEFITEKINHERRPAAMREERARYTDARDAALKAAILKCVDGDIAKLCSYEDDLQPSYDEVIAQVPQEFRIGTKKRPDKKWPSKSIVRKRIMELKKI